MSPASSSSTATSMSERLAEVSLASISPRRLALLQSIGLDVTVVKSGYDEETAASTAAPAGLALLHAERKADQADVSGPPMLVAADTIVDLDGAMFNKPRDGDDARRMLRALSGRWHVVHTGFALIDRRSGTRASGVESTRVKFERLDDGAIDRYVRSGEPDDKAGAYGIQGAGALLVERVDGDFYTVMGLPLARIAAQWRRWGIDIP